MDRWLVVGAGHGVGFSFALLYQPAQGNFNFPRRLTARGWRGIFNYMAKSYTAELDRVFAALADPTRRAIIARLAQGPLTVSEIAEPFSISLPGTSKHLKVLERAGILARTVEGRVHRCRLVPEPIDEAARWIAAQHAFWETKLDALEHYLQQAPSEDTSPDAR